jgi:hypothetical protein
MLLTPTARRALLLTALICGAALAAGCGFGGGKKKATATTRPAVTAAAAPTVSPVPGALGTPPTVGPAARPPITPPPVVSTPSPTPLASPTPAIRTENGLQIQDISFTGRVDADGGLRIRNAPTLDAQVVGSVAQGAIVQVEGKVLNGAEAEQGKGTVWYIVGVNQYIYGAEGYVTPIQGPGAAATPGQ